MADRIKGITIELSGNTQKLQDSLQGVNGKIKDTQAQLKDVNKLLKLDPTNTELLKQKQGLLKTAVQETKEKLDAEKEALRQLETAGNSDKTTESQERLKREIIDTTKSLENYEKQLNQIHPTLAKVHDVSGKVAEKTRGLSTAAAAGAAGMIGMAVQAGKTADDINTMASQYGVSTAEIQKFNFAQDLVDVSTQDMLGSMAKLTKQMGAGSDVFDKLGVSITDANGGMRDSTDVWYECLEALSQVTNETERDIIAQELFGKSAASLSGIIDDGGEALKRLGQEAEDAGLILGQDALDNANKFNNAIDKLKGTAGQAFLEAGANLAEQLIPALETACGAIENILSWWGSLDGSIQAGILTVLALIAAISPVAGIISTVSAAAMALNISMLPLIGTVAAIIAIAAALVAAGVLIYENWDTIKAKAGELKDWIAKKWNEMATAIKKKWDETVSNCKAFIDNIKTAYEDMRAGIAEKIESVKQKLDDWKAKADAIFEGIRSTIQEKIDAAKDKIDAFRDGVSDAFESVRSTVDGKIQAVKAVLDGLSEKVHSIFDSVKSAIDEKINAAADAVSGAIDRIKGFFDFSWSLPHLDLPHFSIDGEFSLKPPSVPHISVDWYAKAMRNGMILNSPTIFGMNGNTLLGAGEAGPEAVVGVSSLMKMIQRATAGNGVTINVYGAQGQDVNELAEIVTDKLTRQLERGRMTWQ